MRTASEPTRSGYALLGAFLGVSLVVGLLAAGLALPGAYATGTVARGGMDFFNSLPDELAEPPLSEQSTVLDDTGRPIAHFYDERRILVPLSKIAPVMREAIISIEDSRFYEHGGVDPKGLLRAFVTNQVNDGRVQGASTLTQQYIKLRLLEAAVTNGDTAAQSAALTKTYTRKLQEIRMAVSLEEKRSKDDILAGYLNIANFGDGTYGVEAASQYFFNGTTASKLTLPQAALLAGLVQSPTRYNPIHNPGAALNRRNIVLARMHELNKITDAQYAAAVASGLGVKPKPLNSGCVTAQFSAYFCAFLRNMIIKDSSFTALGKTDEERSDTLKRGGLTIRTTLNERTQQAALDALKKRVPIGDSSGVGAAAVTLEPGTGKVLAMAQNREYYPGDQPGQTEINYSVDKAYGSSNGFQTGSTFKAFTLAAWLAQGKGLYDVVDGTRVTHSQSEFTNCQGQGVAGPSWNPANSEGTETGPMTVMDATRNSVNAAFVDMATKLSLCDIKNVATKLGVHQAAPQQQCGASSPTTALPDCLPSMVLGVLNISPLTMAAAYAGFAADGKYCKPILVTSITDRDNKQIAVPKPSCNQAIDPTVAHGVTYALKRVLTDGTAAGQGIGRPAAGKTGTTDDSQQTWFVGYTPQRVTAVWVGTNPDPGKEGLSALRDMTIGGQYYGGQVYGATIAAPIWHDIMEVANDGLPEQDWADPNGKMVEGNYVRVPDVRGQSVGEAKATLTQAGFSVTVDGPVSSDVPDGLVAGTSPSAGSRVSPDASVRILVSNGQGGGQGGQGQGGGPGGPGGQGNRVAFRPPLVSPTAIRKR